MIWPSMKNRMAESEEEKRLCINWLSFCKWLVKVQLSRVQISHFFLLAKILFWEVISTQIQSQSDPILYFRKPLNEMHFMCSCLAVKTPRCSLTTSGSLDLVDTVPYVTVMLFRWQICISQLKYKQMTDVLCKITAFECLDKMWHR